MSQEEQEQQEKTKIFSNQKFLGPKICFMPKIFLRTKKFSDPNFFSDPKLGLSKLPSAKVLLKLEFDTKDQVLFETFSLFFFHLCDSQRSSRSQKQHKISDTPKHSTLKIL